jgi:ketosteroid isomerase-like protein
MSLEHDVRWLKDRAEISELLHSFAYALDSQDIKTYAANFTDDGVLEFPQLTITGPGAIFEHVSAQFNPSRVRATHHISANHQIEIDGDRARSRSYFIALHVPANGTEDGVWSSRGWYENQYRRTAEGWRFTHVALRSVWRDGQVPVGAGSGRFGEQDSEIAP